MKAFTIGMSLAVLSTPIADVWAQNSAADQAAAQGLFDEGIRLFNSADYKTACGKFEASLKLVDAMGTRGKLAECYEKMGRTASAWAAYREVAVLAERKGQTRRQKVASKRAARLKPLLSYVAIVVPDTVVVDGLKITRNGSVLSEGVYGTEIAVDPGSYTIVAEAPGYKSRSIDVQVAPSRRESVEIGSLTKLAVPMKVSASTTEPIAPISTEAPTSSVQRIAGMSAVGLGTATLLGGVVVGLIAKSDYDSVFDDGLCDAATNTCSDAGVNAVDDARGKANIATFVSVTGIAIAGVGAYLWLTADDSTNSAERTVRLLPSGNHESLGFSILGQF